MPTRIEHCNWILCIVNYWHGIKNEIMIRVQRKRTKGFKLPPNTKCVNRGTKWGNPIKLMGDIIYINASHRRKILDPWVYLCMGDINDVVELYRLLVTDNISLTELYFESTYDIDWWLDYFRNLDVKELKGKNLACFCSILNKNKYNPCHADILLSLSNDIDLKKVINENILQEELLRKR